MHFVKPKPSKLRLDLTPMIDVIFLIVIFLMTSANFVQRNNLKVQLPQENTSSISTDADVYPTLWLTKDKQVYFDDQRVAWHNLESTLRQYILQQADVDTPSTMIIKGDKEVAYEDVIRLMSIARKAGIRHLSLSTEIVP